MESAPDGTRSARHLSLASTSGARHGAWPVERCPAAGHTSTP